MLWVGGVSGAGAGVAVDKSASCTSEWRLWAQALPAGGGLTLTAEAIAGERHASRPRHRLTVCPLLKTPLFPHVPRPRPCSPACRCIVSAASGKGVFDGSVKVNRLAQKTDAQQLSRNLLLVPRATVNVKPNLQVRVACERLRWG